MPRSTPRRLAIAGVLAAIALAVAPVAAQAASPTCTAKEGDTIARNATTRVFMRTTGTIDDGQDVRVYSCRLHTRTAVLTTRFRNDLDGSLRVEEAILGSSKYLGIMWDEETGTADATDVVLYDLSVPDGRYFTFGRDGLREGLQAVVTRNGALAVQDGGAVTVFDGAGKRALVPAGATALGWGTGTNTVYWTVGPTPFSTVLAGRATES
jgi:hypothetical protein